MSHTPGPWYVVGPPWGEGTDIVAGDPDPHRGSMVATVDPVDWFEDVATIAGDHLDNARLIAAAPEITEAAAALAFRPHVLQVSAGAWGLEHTVVCRAEHQHLHDCPFNRACEQLEEPPAPAGRYFVTLDDDGGLVIGVLADEDPARRLLAALLKAGVGREGG